MEGGATAQLIRTLQGAPDVRLTACALLPKQQIATGSQDGTLLLWNLAPGRPRPLKLGHHGGQVTCIKAAGKTLVSSSTDSTVSIWKSQWETLKKQKPVTLKVHFSPVRCCDLSADERLLLTSSDDKTVKLSSVKERRFMASYLGHANWVRSASLSPTASQIVSGGDDKTVRLWDVEQKTCVQTFYDSASSITCAKFGLDENVIVASGWDSSINLWDLRSFQLRQHYGRAHGASPITQVAIHPNRDLLISGGADRQLRVWDLRAGKLRNSILGHDRPIHSCCWDETSGEHFISGDSEVIFYWSLPAATSTASTPMDDGAKVPIKNSKAVDATTPGGPSCEATMPPVPRATEEELDVPDLPSKEDRGAPMTTMETGTPEQTSLPNGSLHHLLEAAWAGEDQIQPKVDPQDKMLPEAAAMMLEKMVSDMEVLTSLLSSIEVRMARTEETTAEVQQLLQQRRAKMA